MIWRISRRNSIIKWQGYRVSASRLAESNFRYTQGVRRPASHKRLARGGCDMRVAVMAAGAVGGYFGGRMAAAGHDVVFIARGAHLAAIRQAGLRIESPLGDLHL